MIFDVKRISKSYLYYSHWNQTLLKLELLQMLLKKIETELVLVLLSLYRAEKSLHRIGRGLACVGSEKGRVPHER